jgi:hypothetical protein
MSPPNPQHPLALALEWVSKITTIALEMVLPGALGAWLDRKWDTSWMALAGFSLGLVVGVWHLLKMVSPPQKLGSKPHSKTSGDSTDSDNSSGSTD